jgi:histidinol phosphatase-like enzyme
MFNGQSSHDLPERCVGELKKNRTDRSRRFVPDVKQSKPHPDIFEPALSKLGENALDKIVIVGDMPYDAEAATCCFSVSGFFLFLQNGWPPKTRARAHKSQASAYAPAISFSPRAHQRNI